MGTSSQVFVTGVVGTVWPGQFRAEVYSVKFCLQMLIKTVNCDVSDTSLKLFAWCIRKWIPAQEGVSCCWGRQPREVPHRHRMYRTVSLNACLEQIERANAEAVANQIINQVRRADHEERRLRRKAEAEAAGSPIGELLAWTPPSA